MEEVAKAVGGGYCRLQMPLRLALGVGGTVAGHRLGALEMGGGSLPPFQSIPGGGGGGARWVGLSAGVSVGTPTDVPQNDPCDALLILTVHTWGTKFNFKKKLPVSPGVWGSDAKRNSGCFTQPFQRCLCSQARPRPPRTPRNRIPRSIGETDLLPRPQICRLLVDAFARPLQNLIQGFVLPFLGLEVDVGGGAACHPLVCPSVFRRIAGSPMLRHHVCVPPVLARPPLDALPVWHSDFRPDLRVGPWLTAQPTGILYGGH